MFPFALTVLGLAIIYGGALYQRHRERFEPHVRRTLRATARTGEEAR